MYDYSALSGLIVEKFGTQYRFAEAMNVSEHTVSSWLNNKVDWKRSQMLKAAKLLGIPASKIHKYFFKLKVQVERSEGAS